MTNPRRTVTVAGLARRLLRRCFGAARCLSGRAGRLSVADEFAEELDDD